MNEINKIYIKYNTPTKYIIMGLIIAISISTFLYLIEFVIETSFELFSSKKYLLLSLIYIGISIFMFILIKKDNNIIGSSLPQLEINVRYRLNNYNYKKTIPNLIIGNIISTFANIGVGSEAISVSLAGTLGIMVDDLYGEKVEDDVAIAASVGFSCATNAFFSGITYTFEEMLHRFDKKIILKSFLTMFSAFIVLKCLNVNYGIIIPIDNVFHINNFWVLFVITISTVILGWLFSNSYFNLFKFFWNKQKKYRKYYLRIFIIFVIAFILSIFYFEYLGSGEELIKNILILNNIKYVIFIILFRFIYPIVSGNSLVTGGFIIPIMCLGALNGELIFLILKENDLISNNLQGIIIILSMISLFSFITHTPVTSLLLGMSIVFNSSCFVNSLYSFIPFTITLVAIYLIGKLLKNECLYEKMIESIK